MSFMRKKLEEQYQGKLDEMEAELDETRDESGALRVQIKMLMVLLTIVTIVFRFTIHPRKILRMMV